VRCSTGRLTEDIAPFLSRTKGPALKTGVEEIGQRTDSTMEESGEYRVTRHKGRRSKSAKVIFRHLDEAPARRFYKRIPPAPGYVISLWHPDGTLIACTRGLAQPAS
jgi:hypothetical protein